MLNVILGAVALGLLWSVMTIGVFISYRVLDLADLTVEGTIVLGAAVASVIITSGASPYLACAAAMLAGMAAGTVTGLLHTKLGIPAILSGILGMISLYSVNIRVMFKSANISLLRKNVIFTPLTDAGMSKNTAAILIGGVCALLVTAVCYWFFGTELGSAVRATGDNATMARAQGIDTDKAKILGLAISNGLVGLSGSLIAQYMGFSDVQMGSGSIVIGLASVIIGEVLFGRGSFKRALVSLICGAVLYRVIIAFVFEAGMPATDLKLFTAITVTAALCLPDIKNRLSARLGHRKG